MIRKLRDMLTAIACGDALGAQTEGLGPEAIRASYRTPVKSFRRRIHGKQAIVTRGYRPGMITDDTLFTLMNIDRIRSDLRTDGAIGPFTGNRSWLALTRRARGTYLEPISPGFSTIGRRNRMALERNVEQTVESLGCSSAMGISPLAIKNIGRKQRIAADVDNFIKFQHSAQTVSAATATAHAYAEAARGKTSLRRIIGSALWGARAGWRSGDRNIIHDNLKKAFRVAARAGDDAQLMKLLGEEVGLSNKARHVVPVALGIFAYTGGDAYRSAVIATNIGGDTDSFSAIAAGLGALYRGQNFPAKIRRRVEQNGLKLDGYAVKLREISRLGATR